MPTTWDDTKVLHGEIGKYITVARKKGGDWYVGSITNAESRTLRIPLSFLDSQAVYKAFIYSDGGPEIKTKTHVRAEEKDVTSNEILSFEIKAGGGVALRLEKK